MRTVCLFVLYLFGYSFAGWIHELLYFIVKYHRLRRGGILVAPLLPIYGLGAVALVAIFGSHLANPLLVYVASVLLTSAVEFVGHWVMEEVFHVQLWDYHDRRFNLQGRICLANSMGFGLLAMVLLYLLHPAVVHLLAGWDDLAVLVTAGVGAALFVVDLGVASRSMIRVRLDPVAQESIEALHQKFAAQIDHIHQLRDELGDRRARRWALLGLRIHHFTLGHILSTNPGMHHRLARLPAPRQGVER